MDKVLTARPLNVYVLWGRKTENDFETFLGEFDSLAKAKVAYYDHVVANNWWWHGYRISAI